MFMASVWLWNKGKVRTTIEDSKAVAGSKIFKVKDRINVTTTAVMK